MKKKIKDLVLQTQQVTDISLAPNIIQHLFKDIVTRMNSHKEQRIRIPFFGLFYTSHNSYKQALTNLIKKIRKDDALNIPRDPKQVELLRKYFLNRHTMLKELRSNLKKNRTTNDN